jgi:hypothetical protein
VPQTTSFPGLSSLANAIANAEGYGVNNAIPTLANNPGNLVLGDLGGGTLGSGNISIYPDSTSGWNALNNQLNMIGIGQSHVYNPNMSLADMGNLWAGGGQGSTNWVNNVAKSLRVDPNSTIGSILLGKPSAASSSSGTPQSATSNLIDKIGSYVNNLLGNIAGKAITTAEDAALGAIFSSRMIMLVVGVILFAAGVFSFKPAQTVIETTTSGTRRLLTKRSPAANVAASASGKASSSGGAAEGAAEVAAV